MAQCSVRQTHRIREWSHGYLHTGEFTDDAFVSSALTQPVSASVARLPAGKHRCLVVSGCHGSRLIGAGTLQHHLCVMIDDSHYF